MKVGFITLVELREFINKNKSCSEELKQKVISLVFKVDTEQIDNITERNFLVHCYLSKYLKDTGVYSTLIDEEFHTDYILGNTKMEKTSLKNDSTIPLDDIYFFINCEEINHKLNDLGKERIAKVIAYLKRAKEIDIKYTKEYYLFALRSLDKYFIETYLHVALRHNRFTLIHGNYLEYIEGDFDTVKRVKYKG